MFSTGVEAVRLDRFMIAHQLDKRIGAIEDQNCALLRDSMNGGLCVSREVFARDGLGVHV
jgi:hypothetical protein